MRTFKQFIFFYCIEFLLGLLMGFTVNKDFSFILQSPSFWIVPAVFNVIGFLCAFVVYELKLRPIQKKAKIFRNGFIFGFISMIAFIVVIGISNRSNSHDSNNSSQNLDVMKNFVYDDEEYIRLAFKRLESEFNNPNDLLLDAFSVRKIDTVINGNQDTVYNIYFTYFLSNDNDNKYFSKVSVFGEEATLLLYNHDTRTNSEYQIIKAEKEEAEREFMQSLNESLQEIPDSTFEAFIDTLRTTLNE